MPTFSCMQSETSAPVFTLGYQLRSIDQYVAELVDADVQLVVDVRETPWSHKRGFSKTKLKEALAVAGIEYVHLKFAGNPKELRRAAPSHAQCLADYEQHIEADPGIVERFAEYVREWVQQGVRACLLCYERHPGDCHRTILLDRALQVLNQPVTVNHLGPNGAPRFS